MAIAVHAHLVPAPDDFEGKGRSSLHALPNEEEGGGGASPFQQAQEGFSRCLWPVIEGQGHCRAGRGAIQDREETAAWRCDSDGRGGMANEERGCS